MTADEKPPAPKKSRHIRTPQEVAQDLLDQAKARWDRANTAAKKATKAAADAEAAKQAANDELGAANAAIKYAEQHPDLPKAKGGLVTGPVTFPGESGPESKT